MLLTLLESTATTAKQPSGLFWVIYIVILVGFMWLLIIRPQKKQKKQMEDLHKAMEPGDNMHKNAIAEIEKAGSAVVKDEEEDTPVKEEKKEDKKADKKLGKTKE